MKYFLIIFHYQHLDELILHLAIQEFVYKTANENSNYTSNNALYETFKTFSIKVAFVANTTYDMPRVKDLRAIALD